MSSYAIIAVAIFAKAGCGVFLVFFAFAVAYLFRRKARGLLAEALEKMPPQEMIDDLQLGLVRIFAFGPFNQAEDSATM